MQNPSMENPSNQSELLSDTMLLPYDDIMNVSDLNSTVLQELGGFVLFTPPVPSSTTSLVTQSQEQQQQVQVVPDNGGKRSRIPNPSSWRQNMRKAKRNEGQEYLSTKGKTVAARSIKNAGVDCTCPMKC